MPIITSLQNTASVLFDGSPVNSNPVDTLLDLAPTLLKTVSAPNASIGDTLTYTVVITNIGIPALSSLAFTDVLPAGCSYVTDTFKLNGSSVTPVLTGNTLTYTIPSIASLGLATITFQVLVVGGTT